MSVLEILVIPDLTCRGACGWNAERLVCKEEKQSLKM